MVLYGINFFHKTRYGIWKCYFSPSKSIFNHSNIFFSFPKNRLFNFISLAYLSIFGNTTQHHPAVLSLIRFSDVIFCIEYESDLRIFLSHQDSEIF